MNQSGFSLLQIIITTSITTILGSIGIPSILYLIEQEAAVANTNLVISLLHLARSQAITSSRSVIVCPSSDGLDCDKQWGGKLLIYQDNDYDNSFKSSIDTPIKHLSLATDWTINWRAFGNKKYIYFTGGNGEFNQNGTMEICPPQSSDEIRILIINRIGRIRTDLRPFKDSRCA